MSGGIISKFPLIIDEFKKKGYARKVNLRTLQITIREVCDVIDDKKVRKIGEILLEHGYIRQNGPVFDVMQAEPFDFYEEKPKEDSKKQIERITAVLNP